jgi:glycosyltransferase involved in cell wall biosynthesis
MKIPLDQPVLLKKKVCESVAETERASEMISLIFLTWNSADCMEIALESVEGVVGEIVAIDSFSTDGTIEILKKWNARIFEKELQHSWSELRNFAIEQARGEWIFWLDTDETINDKARAMLPFLAQQNVYDAFIFRRRNYLDDQLREDNDCHVRLARQYCRFVGDIHEGLTGFKKSLVVDGAEVIHKKTWAKQKEQNVRYQKFIEDIDERKRHGQNDCSDWRSRKSR